jgi:hypothetical protein
MAFHVIIGAGPVGCETAYQFRRPFLLDSSAATRTFGIEPTPLDDALVETVRAARG